MRIPAGLTSTGMTTDNTASAPAANTPATRTRRKRRHGGDRPGDGPATVLVRADTSTATVGVFIVVGVAAGLIAVIAVVLLARPDPPTLLSGFGQESTWAMPATAVAAALGLTFLIAAVIADRRAEEALRRAWNDQDADAGAGDEADRVRRTP